MAIENETNIGSYSLAPQTKRPLSFPLLKQNETRSDHGSNLPTEEELIAELSNHSGNWSVKFSAAVYQFAADELRSRSTTRSLGEMIEAACFKAVEVRLAECAANRHESGFFEH